MHPTDLSLEKLRRISPHKKQMWVAIHVNQTGNSPLRDNAVAELEAAMEGGADAVILMNLRCQLAELEDVIQYVRPRYPSISLGVNYLGDDKEPYGYLDSFRLAREYNLQIAWTDFSGIDLIEERPEISLHQIEEARPESVFYCSGVHMKYSVLKNPSKSIEKSALQALGWMDGVIVTGPATGVACDPEIAKRARSVIGNAPLGVASGASAQNVHTIRDVVDFYIVASSLKGENNRIEREKVQDLREALGRERWSGAE